MIKVRRKSRRGKAPRPTFVLSTRTADVHCRRPRSRTTAIEGESVQLAAPSSATVQGNSKFSGLRARGNHIFNRRLTNG
jgi:hypothetical protein